MYDFISYLCERDCDLYISNLDFIMERSVAEVESIKPKDSRWLNSYTYNFNVDGDNCGSQLSPCYSVSFSDLKKPSVSFYRNGSTKDVRGGFGPRVFDGVFYAIWEFIKKNSPDSLDWSPRAKDSKNPITGEIENPQGREKAYDIFSIKSLFPDYYVSPNKNYWISREIYENSYVSKGYPEIPEELTVSSNPGEKRKFLEKIRSFHNSLLDSNYQSQNSNRWSSNSSQSNDPFFTQQRGFTPRLQRASQNNIDLIRRHYHFSFGDYVVPKILEINYRQESSKREFYNLFPSSIRGFDNWIKQIKSAKGKVVSLFEYESYQGAANEIAELAVEVVFENPLNPASKENFLFYFTDLKIYDDQQEKRLISMVTGTT